MGLIALCTVSLKRNLYQKVFPKYFNPNFRICKSTSKHKYKSVQKKI